MNEEEFRRMIMGTTAVALVSHPNYEEYARRYDETVRDAEERKRIARREELYWLAEQSYERNMESWCNPCACRCQR